MQHTVWQNVFIQTPYLKLKTQPFCIAWHGLILDSYSAQLIKHVNEMFFSPTFM